MAIAAAILGIAREGAIKTRIMYHASLSFEQLQGNLELLTALGLLKYDEEEKKYRTMEKGITFLNKCVEMEKMFDPSIRSKRVEVMWDRLKTALESRFHKLEDQMVGRRDLVTTFNIRMDASFSGDEQTGYAVKIQVTT